MPIRRGRNMPINDSYQRDTTLAVIRDVERKLLRCHRTKLQIARWLDGERCPNKYKLNALHASEVESLTRGQKPASLTVLQKNVHGIDGKGSTGCRHQLDNADNLYDGALILCLTALQRLTW